MNACSDFLWPVRAKEPKRKAEEQRQPEEEERGEEQEEEQAEQDSVTDWNQAALEDEAQIRMLYRYAYPIRELVKTLFPKLAADVSFTRCGRQAFQGDLPAIGPWHWNCAEAPLQLPQPLAAISDGKQALSLVFLAAVPAAAFLHRIHAPAPGTASLPLLTNEYRLEMPAFYEQHQHSFAEAAAAADNVVAAAAVDPAVRPPLLVLPRPGRTPTTPAHPHAQGHVRAAGHPAVACLHSTWSESAQGPDAAAPPPPMHAQGPDDVVPPPGDPRYDADDIPALPLLPPPDCASGNTEAEQPPAERTHGPQRDMHWPGVTATGMDTEGAWPSEQSQQAQQAQRHMWDASHAQHGAAGTWASGAGGHISAFGGALAVLRVLCCQRFNEGSAMSCGPVVGGHDKS